MTRIDGNINGVYGFSDDYSKKTEVNNKADLKGSLFDKLDKNKDGSISEIEWDQSGYSKNEIISLKQAVFFAERSVNKWFMHDKNMDGGQNNVEKMMWFTHNQNQEQPQALNMKPEEFAAKNNMVFDNSVKFDDFKAWIDRWVNDPEPRVGFKAGAEKQLGRKLTEDEVQLLYDAAKNQANRWLFKSESLYHTCNITSYTRLVTNDGTSCCGGDVDVPPMESQQLLVQAAVVDKFGNHPYCTVKVFAPLEYNDNSAEECKNRLAWAAFKTVPLEDVKNMSPAEYKKYQAEWQKVRAMKASDYRTLLKPGNEKALQDFEKNSLMSVKQIVEYIDIVEHHTGKDWDSEDWIIDGITFNKISDDVNGISDDPGLLNGKTRADIPADRKDWLDYLEKTVCCSTNLKSNIYPF